MKSRRQKILSVVLALAVFAGCLAPSVDVKASGNAMPIPYQKSITISKGGFFEIDMGKKVTGYMVKGISTDNKKVLSPIASYNECGPVIQGLKKGSATLTIRSKKGGRWKNYSIKVKVVAYKNPVKNIKIGSKTLTSRFKKADANVVYKPKAKSEKISVKPASGWKVKSIAYQYLGKAKKIKNNKNVTYKDGGSLVVTLYKKKTKQREFLWIDVDSAGLPDSASE